MAIYMVWAMPGTGMTLWCSTRMRQVKARGGLVAVVGAIALKPDIQLEALSDPRHVLSLTPSMALDATDQPNAVFVADAHAWLYGSSDTINRAILGFIFTARRLGWDVYLQGQFDADRLRMIGGAADYAVRNARVTDLAYVRQSALEQA